MKKLFAIAFNLFLVLNFSSLVHSQSNSEKNLSPIEYLEKYFEFRKSFTHSSDSKKPASFSYSKSEGKEAEIEIDAALLYKNFEGVNSGIAPVIGFNYKTSSTDKTEKIYGGLSGFYNIGNIKSGMLKIEPNIFFARDFTKEENLLDVNTTFAPRFPNFVIPIYNLSARKLKYDGTDDKWYFAINPSVGIAYEFVIDNDRMSYVKDLHTRYKAVLTLKRYFLEFDVFGSFITELENRKREEKEYGARLSFFLDKKETTSINLNYSKKNKINDSKLKEDIKIGFGVKI